MDKELVGMIKKETRSYLLLAIIIVLVIASVIFAHRLLTAGYPTHSDVFYMGVECGILLMMFLVCLSLIFSFLYLLSERVIAEPKELIIRQRAECSDSLEW
jgi:uncharacterized membrane protein